MTTDCKLPIRSEKDKLLEVLWAAYELVLSVRDKHDIDNLDDFECPLMRRLAKAVYDAR